MPAARTLAARARTWPQRLVVVTGCMVVAICLSTSGVFAYIWVKYGQIDRVKGIELFEASDAANFLLVGTDSREGLDPDDPDAGGFLGDTGCECTDTIMVLRIDPKEKRAYLLSFPRDLWIPISGTGKTNRINTAHAHGAQTLIDTIQDNFDIPIHHYVEINFVGFERLVDAVGGIPMWFDAPVRDRHTGLDVPEAKCQVLDGEQARKFVRSRYLEYLGEDGEWHRDQTADLGRITRQQVFVRRSIDKAVSKGLTNPATLNELVSAGVANVSLDEYLEARDLLSLGRAFANFDSNDLVSYSIPSEPLRTSAGARVQLPLMNKAQTMLNVFRGLPVGTLAPEAIDVTVLNGTGVDGQAADVAGALGEIGFNIVEVASYPTGDVQRTSVVYGGYGEGAARRVAAHISGGAALVFDADLEGPEVTVVTGADFTTIHDQPTPKGSADDKRTTTTTEATTRTTTGGSSTTAGEQTTTTTEPTTTTTVIGYKTGEPPDDVDCG